MRWFDVKTINRKLLTGVESVELEDGSSFGVSGYVAIVNLKNGFVYDDYCHTFTAYTKKELIDFLKNDIVKE